MYGNPSGKSSTPVLIPVHNAVRTVALAAFDGISALLGIHLDAQLPAALAGLQLCQLALVLYRLV